MAILSVSRERTLAAPQKIGKVGSLETFAALVTSGWFSKHRRSLRYERTGKTRTKRTLPLTQPMAAFQVS